VHLADALWDALRGVHDALQRALSEAEADRRRPRNRVLRAVLAEWSDKAAAWLAAKEEPGPDLTAIGRGDWLEE
jgi:hypothetical protein